MSDLWKFPAHVHGTETEDEYKMAFVNANFDAVKNSIAKSLFNAKLEKPHFLTFQLQVHAQAVTGEKGDE